MPERIEIEIKDDSANQAPPNQTDRDTVAAEAAAREAVARANAAATASQSPTGGSAGLARMTSGAHLAVPSIPSPAVAAGIPPGTPPGEDPVSKRVVELARTKWREGIDEQGRRRAEDAAKRENDERAERRRRGESAAKEDAEARAQMLRSNAGHLGRAAQLAGMAGQQGAAAGLGGAGAAMSGLAAGGPMGAAAAAIPFALQYLQQKQEDLKKKEIEAIERVTRALGSMSDAASKFASGDNLGGKFEVSSTIRDVLKEQEVISEKQAKYFQMGEQSVKSIEGMKASFIRRGEELAQFSPDLTMASVKSQQAKFKSDMQEAKELGPLIAKLTERESAAEAKMREALLPMKAAILEKLIPAADRLSNIVGNAGNVGDTIESAIKNAIRGSGLEKLVPGLQAWLDKEKEKKVKPDDDPWRVWREHVIPAFDRGFERLARATEETAGNRAQVVGIAAGGTLNIPILRNR